MGLEIWSVRLSKQSSKKVDQLIPKPVKKENGVVLYENQKDKEIFKKLYKKIHIYAVCVKLTKLIKHVSTKLPLHSFCPC